MRENMEYVLNQIPSQIRSQFKVTVKHVAPPGSYHTKEQFQQHGPLTYIHQETGHENTRRRNNKRL
jgi:hypothetical protein